MMTWYVDDDVCESITWLWWWRQRVYDVNGDYDVMWMVMTTSNIVWRDLWWWHQRVHDVIGDDDDVAVICRSTNNPCLNGGTCSPNYLNSPGYTCTCAPGFTGISCGTSKSPNKEINNLIDRSISKLSNQSITEEIYTAQCLQDRFQALGYLGIHPNVQLEVVPAEDQT
jgi:hypothetical protein